MERDTKLELTFLGYHWEWSGDLFHMTHEDGRTARVYVDSLGETWVDIRRVPEGGWFPTERVEAFRSFEAAEQIAESLKGEGFGNRRHSQYAHRVKQREV
jgi:hypothetical protein